MTNFDEKFMSYALTLAEKTLGMASSNPSVAAIITLDNVIIASATTSINGRPHAEKNAIDKIKNKEILKNCTIYITLEPCFHEGSGPACSLELIKNNFKKVVIATKDQDERTNGQGILALKNAGIEVIYGILENRAKKLYEPFFKARTSKIPYITLKIATSLDGKIATRNFDSKWISCEKSRKFTNYLRITHNAILVGANTVKKDNPKLNCRIKGLEKYSPQKFIISNGCDFDFNYAIFQDKVSIITNKEGLPPHIETIKCPSTNGLIDLRAALEKLYQLKINSVLVEAGGNLATQFLQQNLVDKLVWVRSNKIIGNDGIAAIGDLGIADITSSISHFNRCDIKEFDDDIIEIFLNQK
jgi:diaminohydroxyphosphoribosylaminopyrimidine deaminase/5-amino-6-(5-phosphoribosylamino)uracil reductase